MRGPESDRRFYNLPACDLQKPSRDASQRFQRESKRVIEQTGRLEDERLGELLGCLNKESKVITYLLIRPGRYITTAELRNDVKEFQGDDPGWIMDHNVAVNYSRNNFEPAGLVKSAEITVGAYAIKKTDEGSRVDALAGLLLEYSSSHPTIELNRIFGEKFSSLTRYNIIKQLLSEESPLRVGDLSERLGIDPRAISQTLRKMDSAGIIDFHTWRFLPFVFYSPSDQLPDRELKLRKETKLPGEIVAVINHAEKALSPSEVAKRVLKNRQNQGENLKNYKDFVLRVTRMMSELESIGFIKSNAEPQTQVRMNSKQKEDLIELVELIEKFRAGDVDTINRGFRFASEIVSGDYSNRVADLMNKTRKSSPFANRRQKAETKHLLEQILENQRLSANQLVEALKNMGIILCKHYVNSLLKEMQDSKTITGNKEKLELIWETSEV